MRSEQSWRKTKSSTAIPTTTRRRRASRNSTKWSVLMRGMRRRVCWVADVVRVEEGVDVALLPHSGDEVRASVEEPPRRAVECAG